VPAETAQGSSAEMTASALINRQLSGKGLVLPVVAKQQRRL
jgi:hypothetical protein